MNSIEASNLPIEFVNLLRFHIPEDKQSLLHVCPSGLVVSVAQNNSGFELIGCSCCYLVSLSTDEDGLPLLNGVPAIRAMDVMCLENISIEVQANLWLCYNCKMPLMQLLPNWDTAKL